VPKREGSYLIRSSKEMAVDLVQGQLRSLSSNCIFVPSSTCISRTVPSMAFIVEESIEVKWRVISAFGAF
jgi:hypothetical protein